MKSMEIGSNTSLKSNALLKLIFFKCGFWGYLGDENRPKMEETVNEKRSDFEAKV